MQTSLSVFQNQLIDYAGLFPPANLSLESALENYKTYKNSEHAWILGPFVIPIARLQELASLLPTWSNKEPLALSVIAQRTNSDADFKEQFLNDMQQLQEFSKQYKDKVKIAMLELPFGSIIPTADMLKVIAAEANTFEMPVFCEVAFLDDWKKHISETLDVLSRYNHTHPSRLGVKLRTGGIQADLIPSIEKVAFVLAACRDRQLPIKFTAGLHHPIRMYRDEVNAKMHGFLNIFMAGMLAYTQHLSANELEEILADETPNHFSIQETSLNWKHLQLTTSFIEALRNQAILSFGSCSFDEPIEELAELKNNQEAYL